MLTVRRCLRVQRCALASLPERAAPVRCLSTNDSSENWNDFNNVAKVGRLGRQARNTQCSLSWLMHCHCFSLRNRSCATSPGSKASMALCPRRSCSKNLATAAWSKPSARSTAAWRRWRRSSASRSRRTRSRRGSACRLAPSAARSATSGLCSTISTSWRRTNSICSPARGKLPRSMRRPRECCVDRSCNLKCTACSAHDALLSVFIGDTAKPLRGIDQLESSQCAQHRSYNRHTDERPCILPVIILFYSSYSEPPQAPVTTCKSPAQQPTAPSSCASADSSRPLSPTPTCRPLQAHHL